MSGPEEASAAPLEAPVIDLELWWGSARWLPAGERLTALLRAAGVSFHDGSSRFVRAPAAALVAAGGIPIERDENGCMGFSGMPMRPDFVGWLAARQRESMGYAASMTYLDPSDRGPSALAEGAIGRGHFSVAHLASVTLLVAGFSCAVENELNGQRDIVHLARLTEARTEAQCSPPLCVLYEEELPLFTSIDEHLRAHHAAAFEPRVGEDRASRMARLESVNLAHPAAKATMVLLTGTIRSLQKMVSSIDDPGREEEYRRVLREINTAMHALHPSLFKSSDEYSFRPRYRRGA